MLNFSSVFISMEQQSNYIYISATSSDTGESLKDSTVISGAFEGEWGGGVK